MWYPDSLVPVTIPTGPFDRLTAGVVAEAMVERTVDRRAILH